MTVRKDWARCYILTVLIGWILLGAAIVAWSVGFLAGLIVRLQFGS